MTSARPITYEDIARVPAPGMNAPVDLRFSPDGRLVTWLYSSAGTMSRALWAFDRQTGTQRPLLEPRDGAGGDLTREEQLRQERQRQYGSGVTGHAWSAEGSTLLVQRGGETFVQIWPDGAPMRVSAGPGVLDPRLSHDGKRVAYVQNGELYVQDIEPSGPPRRLTFDAAEADEHGDRVVTNGLAEFVAQEEMGRSAGFWWSPDGTALAYEQVNTSAIPYFYIVHPGTDAVEIEAHRYPFAGKANASVRLGVIPVSGGETVWLDWASEPDSYLARVHWTPDGPVLVQEQPRAQRSLHLRRIDPATGTAETLWTEEASPWVNLHDDLRFVRRKDDARDAYSILWSSERTGKRELYLYGRGGKLLQQISDGRISIDLVRAVDPEGGFVYVDGWDETPLERHLFRIPLAGGAAERLTSQPGVHGCPVSPRFDAFVDVHSSVTAPPRATLRSLDGGALASIPAGYQPDPRLAELDLPAPAFFSFSTEDGDTLYAAVYAPRDLPPGSRAPVVVDVYGGPHMQQVVNTWGMTADLRNQKMAQDGYFVLVVDNRGSARRGLTFEGKIAGNTGDLEVQDQVAGIRALAARYPEADPDRAGIYGWSYGGYMALMCLARAPEAFRVAVAGAPVTHWDGYDTHYTERYMGHPAENPGGYRAASVMAHADKIKGKLLIIHGMIDENVHFRHTARLVSALVEANKPHDLLIYPNERHMPRSEKDRVQMETRVVEYFQRHLVGAARAVP